MTVMRWSHDLGVEVTADAYLRCFEVYFCPLLGGLCSVVLAVVCVCVLSLESHLLSEAWL